MKYRRLAGSRRGYGKWYSLWLGDDHLMSVESTGYSEEYTRFYFKDIQAVIIRRTRTGKVWNGVLGTILACFAIAVIANGSDRSMQIFVAVFSLPFLLLLLVNLFRGETCSCHVRTPVGMEELPALDRVRKTKKILARLRLLITECQGRLGREELAAFVAEAKNLPPPAVRPAAKGTAPAAGGATSPTYRGGFHRTAFLMLVTEGALTFLQTLENSKALVSLSTVTTLLFLLLAVIALIRQKEVPVAPLAGWMTWGGIGLTVSGTVAGFFFMIFLRIDDFKRGTPRNNELVDLYAAIQPADHPSFAYFLLIYAAIAAGMGIAGLIALGVNRAAAGRQRP
jgi:uncharacterized integral membrane protein